MKELSAQILRDVLNLLANGLSSRLVASRLGIGRSTVDNIRKNASNPPPVLPKGRKKILTPQHIRFLDRHMQHNPFTSIREASQVLKAQYNVQVSKATVRRALRFNHHKARKIVKKPLLTKRHRDARLQFALAHKDWTLDDWKRVVWSDETKINRFGSDGKQHCWVKDAGFSSKLVRPTVKFGGGSIMIWGCMTYAGLGNMHEVEGKMNADQYIQILDQSLLPTMRSMRAFPFEKLIFQQDNDPKHTSKKALKWIRDQGLELMKWPSQSPDLNPIEHMWTLLKKRLGSQYNDIPSSMRALAERTREQWGEITPQACQDLIESMPRRVAAVIKAKGGHTKY